MVSGLINANPVVYQKKERLVRGTTSSINAPSTASIDELAADPIDQLEVFELLQVTRKPRQPVPPPSFHPRPPPSSKPVPPPPSLASEPPSLKNNVAPPPPSLASEPPPLKNNVAPEVQDLLDAHNAVRKGLGLGPLQWDERLAAYARQYAQRRSADCSIVHSGAPYGENLAWSSGELSAISAVQMWVVEGVFYNYATNMCLTGEECGHYTQVVWRDTTRIGCGKVGSGNGGGTFLVCSYDPPGN